MLCGTSVFLLRSGCADRGFLGREPVRGAVGEPDQRQHHGHLDQHAYDSDQRGNRVEAEEPDGDGDSQLEKVRRADHRAGCGRQTSG